MHRANFLGRFMLALGLCLGLAKPLSAQDSLRAVFVVGHLEDQTMDAIKETNEIAEMLIRHGVKVRRFYDKYADWGNICKAAEGAHILYYRGHGALWSVLTINQFVAPEQVAKDLKLAPGALVVMHNACFAAGTSATDRKDIGQAEAAKRVSTYAEAFFRAGAGAYWAENTIERQKGLLAFLMGYSIEDIFEQALCYYDPKMYGRTTNIRVEFRRKKWQGMEMSLASTLPYPGSKRQFITYLANGKTKIEEIPDFKTYNIAYIASPNYRLPGVKPRDKSAVKPASSPSKP